MEHELFYPYYMFAARDSLQHIPVLIWHIFSTALPVHWYCIYTWTAREAHM